jgi:hypothetical protein
MEDKTDESPAEEIIETPSEVIENDSPEAVDALEQASDVEGDLIENPGLEEVEDDSDEEVIEPDSPDADAGDEPDAEQAPEPPEPDAEPEPQPQPAPEAAPEAPVDPGAFQPKGDYSFEVTTLDGKTVKITSQAEADAFAEQLDKEEGLISVSQLTKFTRGVSRMDNGLEREQGEWQANKTKFEEQTQANEARETQIANWGKELKYLETKGLLPKIDATKDRDWLGNKEDEAVKARMDVFAWMDTENKARTEAGIAPVTSAVDAFQMMRAEQAEQSASDAKNEAGDKRRAKGSMVGGNAPHLPSNMPKNSIVGEGGSLNDVLHDFQMNM